MIERVGRFSTCPFQRYSRKDLNIQPIRVGWWAHIAQVINFSSHELFHYSIHNIGVDQRAITSNTYNDVRLNLRSYLHISIKNIFFTSCDTFIPKRPNVIHQRLVDGIGGCRHYNLLERLCS